MVSPGEGTIVAMTVMTAVTMVATATRRSIAATIDMQAPVCRLGR